MIENCSLHFRVFGVPATLAVGGYPARSPLTAAGEVISHRAATRLDELVTKCDAADGMLGKKAPAD